MTKERTKEQNNEQINKQKKKRTDSIANKQRIERMNE